MYYNYYGRECNMAELWRQKTLAHRGCTQDCGEKPANASDDCRLSNSARHCALQPLQFLMQPCPLDDARIFHVAGHSRAWTVAREPGNHSH